MDIVWVKLDNTSYAAAIIGIYISPSTSVEDYHEIFSYTEQQCTSYKNILILGDFNIPQYAAHFLHNNNQANLYGSSVPLNEFIIYNE